MNKFQIFFSLVFIKIKLNAKIFDIHAKKKKNTNPALRPRKINLLKERLIFKIK